MNEPLVSIITPAYNHERFIGECIESVLAQSYKQWEMLIVDDGSTDGTVERASSFTDSRIRILPQQNRGIARLGETYNVGLAEAKGDLIAVLEADDFWPPGKLEFQVPDFQNADVVISWGVLSVVDENGAEIGRHPGSLPAEDIRTNTPAGRAGFAMMGFRFLSFAATATLLIRKSALDHIGGFVQPADTPFVDLPTTARLSLEGRWLFHEEVLGCWRRHSASATRNGYPRMINAAYRWARRFAKEYGAQLPASPEEWEELNNEWSVTQKDRLIATGRTLLQDREFKRAGACFEQALKFPVGPRTKQMLQTATALCSKGVSPEFVFRLAKQPDWQAYLGSPARDPLIDPTIPPEEFGPFAIGPLA